MSAFQVSENHIGAIIRWYYLDCPDYHMAQWRGNRPNLDNVQDMLDVLALECYRSVRFRYPTGDLPGPISAGDGPVKCHARLSEYPKLTPVAVLKAIDCLAYQSCEHDGWEKSVACDLLQAIKSAAISALPGYDEAPWGID